jgi:Mrp family chromosome partitioning ATPase
MEKGEIVSDQDSKINYDDDSAYKSNEKLVRLIKTIIVNPVRAKYVDETVIKYKFYNSFNYSILVRENPSINLTVGVTSAKAGDGKTLIASNLAVSLAMVSQKSTVLVDLNIVKPRLHKIFGVQLGPGLLEALNHGDIHISQTAIDNLFVLTAGKVIIPHENLFKQTTIAPTSNKEQITPSLGLEQFPAFRDIIYSLEQKYELVIIDMPAITSAQVPVLFTNQFQGLIVVIKSGETKREDLNLMFQRINTSQVFGFVFNRTKKNIS